MNEFKDLFSRQASAYARFRPPYPDDLFEYLARVAPERRLAWDCATGNGQAALKLARHFERVVATDASEKQLASAAAHPKVAYRLAAAESSGLEDGSVDLITVAQALHWFKGGEFFQEAKRVLKPRGVIAVWCYALARMRPAVDAVIRRFYEETLAGCWEPERRLIEQGYRGEPFPFGEIKAPRFEMKAEWSLEKLLGYLGTWSAVQAFIKKNGRDPLEPLSGELKASWGAQPKLEARWTLALRVGRKS